MLRTFLFSTALLVQAQSFEVASVKRHPGEVIISADPRVLGNRVVGTASTLLDLIAGAYEIRSGQISGGPAWIKTLHFDIDAKAPGDAAPSAEQARAMMQALLAERFKLQFHRETRDVPIYALVVGPKGAKLNASSADAVPGGFVRGTAEGIHMETKGSSLDKLAAQLSVTAGRPVMDRTGLRGLYDYNLDWFPANRVPPAESTVPSMFVAVQEQLGLRLESTTGPQEFLVIDTARQPDEN
jgi:uncharacterized protein (TIGR03435 family)